MANKRTKEQKKKAQQQRSSLTNTQISTTINQLPENNSSSQPVAFSYTAQQKVNSTVSRPTATLEMPSYVSSDLKKTAVIATLLFIVLVGIYSYLRYN
jgi:preprotein translocase subunit SecF